MENNKKNSSAVVIVILVTLIIVLGGYIGYDKFVAKNNKCNCNTVKNNDKEDNKEKTEEEDVKYVFDESKIYNKDDSYRYKVADKNEFAGYIKDTDNGIIVIDASYNIKYEIAKKYKARIETPIFKGGPGMENYKAILLSEDGTIEYLKYDELSSDLNGNDKYGFRLYKVNNLKNVVKLYLVELSSDRTVSPNGLTVVAQTKDGMLYDLYDYVYGDTYLIDSSN
jgi:hypothetical protein